MAVRPRHLHHARAGVHQRLGHVLHRILGPKTSIVAYAVSLPNHPFSALGASGSKPWRFSQTPHCRSGPASPERVARPADMFSLMSSCASLLLLFIWPFNCFNSRLCSSAMASNPPLPQRNVTNWVVHSFIFALVLNQLLQPQVSPLRSSRKFSDLRRRVASLGSSRYWTLVYKASPDMRLHARDFKEW